MIYDDYYNGVLFKENKDKYYCEKLNTYLGLKSIKMHLLMYSALKKEDINLIKGLVGFLNQVDKRDDDSCCYLRAVLNTSEIFDLGKYLPDIVDDIVTLAIKLNDWTICKNLPNLLVISYFRSRDRNRLINIVERGYTDIITDLYMRGYPFHRLKRITQFLLRRASKFNQPEIFRLLIKYGNLSCYDINTCDFYHLRYIQKNKSWKFMDLLLVYCYNCLDEYTTYAAKMGYEELLSYCISHGGRVNSSYFHPNVKHMEPICTARTYITKSAGSNIASNQI